MIILLVLILGALLFPGIMRGAVYIILIMLAVAAAGAG